MGKRNSVDSNEYENGHAVTGRPIGSTGFKKNYGTAYDDDNDENGCCAGIITIFSYILVFLTLPISIWGCVKVVQEYERAVIFRLGRLRSGGAKGPGLFFIIPCELGPSTCPRRRSSPRTASLSA